MGPFNPRGLREPAFAGRVQEPVLLCVRVRVVLAAGAGRDKKFFVRATECLAKAHELNQLKNRKEHIFTNFFANITLKPISLQ